jgi:hypothetical protein
MQKATEDPSSAALLNVTIFRARIVVQAVTLTGMLTIAMR